MAIIKILKTLSDTELCALANEVNNPNISNVDILKQLISKSNCDLYEKKLFEEMAIGIFPEKLSYELSLRLISANLSRCKC